MMQLKQIQHIKVLWALALPFSLYTHLQAQLSPFPCNGKLILSHNNDNTPPNILEAITVEDNAISFELLAIYSNMTFNATGFNPLDHFIYAYDGQNIVRMGEGGTWETVAASPQLAAFESYAGACSPEGKFLLDNRADHKWYLFDLSSPNPEIPEQVISLTWDPSTGNNGPAILFVDDMCYSPFESKIVYTFQRNLPSGSSNPAPSLTNGHLLKINLDPASTDFGKVFSVGPITDPDIKLINAMFFGNDGFLYGYASKTIGPVLSKHLIRIDPSTAETQAVGIGPTASYLDGCSCISNVYCGMEVVKDTATCFNEEIKIRIYIINRLSIPVYDITFKDTLKQGLKIKHIEHLTPGAGYVVHLTPDTIIWFSDIDLNPKDTVSFIVTVDISAGIPGTTYENQGWLENLPTVPETLASDNMGTPAVFSDPVRFYLADPTEISFDETWLFEPLDCGGTTARLSVTLKSGLILNSKTYLITYSIHNDTSFQTLYVTAEQDSILQWTVEGEGSIEISHIQLVSNPDCQLPLNGNYFFDPSYPDTTYLDICRNTTPYLLYPEHIPDTISEIQWISSWAPHWQSIDSFPLTLFPEELPLRSILGIKFNLDTCEITQWYKLNIHNAPIIDLGTPQTLKGGIPVSFTPLMSFNTSKINWIVRFDQTEINCEHCNSISFTPTSEGIIIAQAFSEKGCSATDSITFSIISDTSIYVPNCFSPNFDGFNDLFHPFFGYSINYVELFEIYDRWGELIFKAANYDPREKLVAWDGSFRGVPLSPSVFVWRLICRSFDNKKIDISGSVTLLK